MLLLLLLLSELVSPHENTLWSMSKPANSNILSSIAVYSPNSISDRLYMLCIVVYILHHVNCHVVASLWASQHLFRSPHENSLWSMSKPANSNILSSIAVYSPIAISDRLYMLCIVVYILHHVNCHVVATLCASQHLPDEHIVHEVAPVTLKVFVEHSTHSDAVV